MYPRFILDNFAENKKLSILDKHTLKQFKLPPYRAMGEKDFTNVRISNDTIISFENKFTFIEDAAAPIISQIVQRKSLDFLTPMQAATLHTFVVIQFLRSKRRRLDWNAIGDEIKKRWPDAKFNPCEDEISDEEIEKFAALNSTFSNLEELAAALALKHAYLLIKNCPGEIYVSDNPFVMYNSRDYGPYGNIGLAVPHIEIYYPLSADIVLAYMCPLTVAEIEEIHAASDKELDLRFSKGFLSPRGLSLSDQREIEEAREELRRAKSHWAMIKEKRLAPIDSQNLMFLNSLQISSSYRYLACRKAEFEFAIKALSERPHWKEGLAIQFN